MYLLPVIIAWSSFTQSIAPPQTPAAAITVDAAHPAHAASPKLFGIFFEEINHAGDGGLYAEMIRNRAFSSRDALEAWTPLEGARISVDEALPLNQWNPRELRIEAGHPGGGVANAGFWGMAVRRGEAYRLTIFARSDAPGGTLVASLDGAAGPAASSGRIGPLAPQWKKWSVVLTGRRDDAAARLTLRAAEPGTYFIAFASLMPAHTFKGRANGLRRDLASMLADLKPSFVRFPGGCFCEGDQLVNAFRWKKTIGPIWERPGHWNLWGYHSTDGLGFHEYLQMCEDLGAEPLFVINCGMAHGGNVPLDELGPWVQDALDALEYANGPVTSRWGALRAANGHPKPFHLRMLEIGNENGGPAYEERYARFYDAIKARYPDVQLIADIPVRSRPADLIDEHYYSNPGFFVDNATRYDRYSRTGPRIYVGEYAVTQECGKGNLRAAAAEAAFMTGLERNSDVVSMASYAPLFVNVNNRAWNPDAICFDAARCYGTPSYWVQWLFSRNRIQQVLPSKIQATLPARQPVTGAIGLGTWRTQAEYRDVRVSADGQTLFADDFTHGAAQWKPYRGAWSVGDGVYRQNDLAEDDRAVAGDVRWTNYTLTLQARKIGGAEGFLIMFHVRDRDNWYWWNIGGWGNTRHAIEKCSGGLKSIIGRDVPGSVEEGRWYSVRVEVNGDHIRCFLNGRLIHDVTDRPAGPLAASAGAAENGRTVVVKIANNGAQQMDVSLRILGAKPARKAVMWLIASADPEDENSFESPRHVAPAQHSITVNSSRISLRLPPFSVAALRVPIRR